MYKGISKNSNEIKPNYIYCCFEGKVSGYDYIEEALANGATKIIGEKNLNFPQYEQVADINVAMATYAQKIFNNPQTKLKLIGVTGTDGKTSTAILIDKILNKLSKSSYLGTNGFFINEKKKEYTGFTTPFSDILYKNLQESTFAKSKNFVMEVSSHALAQNRLGELEFDFAVFTNLSKEHLDFHKTMEEYFQQKAKLFKKIKSIGKAIINIDDQYGKKLANSLKKENKITLSLTDINADYYVNKINLKLNKTEFSLTSKNKTYQIESPLLAEFNIYNLISAIAVVENMGYPIEKILTLIPHLDIPGRLEKVENDLNLNIIIDFAHTADAINKVMKFINKTNDGKGKIHVLTGSAGERDRQKRPAMGEEAAKYSKFLYLTEDDPRSEKVEQINADLKKGITNSKCQIFEIEKRKEAIQTMLKNAATNDTLVLFGKGEMRLMYYDGYTNPYYEKEILNEQIKKFKDNNDNT